MIDRDFIFWMTEELRRFAEPLENALGSHANFIAFLGRYGWSPPVGSFDIEDVRTACDLTGDLTTGTVLFGELLSPDGDVPVDKYLALLDTFRSIAEKIRRLSSRPAPAGLSATLWSTFGSDLLHGLVADYLEVYHSPLFAILIATGIVQELPIEADGTPDRIAFVRRRVHWERIKQLFTDPQELVRDEYGWNAPSGLRFEHLIDRLNRVLGLFRLPTELRDPTPALRDLYYAPGNPELSRVRELRVHLMAGRSSTNELLEYTLIALPIPPVGAPGSSPAGLVLAPSFVLDAQPEGALWPFSLEYGGVLQSEAGVRIEVDPDHVAVVRGGPASTTVDASFALFSDSPNASLLVGSEFSHRLQLHGWRIGITVSGPIADPEISLELDLTGLEVIAAFAEGDSFLAELFDGKSKPTGFDAGVVWSSKTGLHFRSAGTLEITIPVHEKIGPVELTHAVVGLTPKDDKTTVSVGVSGSGKLGPVSFAVANVGVKAALTPVAEGEPAGVLGDLDLDFGFKFPDGVGLAIETSAVSGGGYLEYSEARAEYAGILALDVAGIEVGARGLLTTRLPNDEPGYSFVAVVSSEFTPIQLGMGFTLNGVGGLLGIHRSASIEALRSAMRESRIDDLLFPEDPIAQAVRLTSDLRSFFPPTKGRHIFGPAAKIGWGTPPLVEADLAVLIEVPAPIRVVLLGAVRAALPSQDAALIELNIDVVGMIDFGGKRLEIDAVLSHSHVLGFPLTGGAALRLTWGEMPNFALAIGGFNKRFRPPAGFPSLERVKINIGAKTNPRIDIQGYLALTSNSAQLGARAELYAEKYGLSIHGWVGFDTLFIFRPFSFVADLSAGVDLMRGDTVLAAVHLDATLSGPRPWRAWGEACLEIWLLPDLCVPFDVEWGSRGGVEAPATRVWPLLEAAMEDPRNWSGAPAAGAARVVTTAPAVGAAAETLVDPVGRIELRQTIAPFNRKLTKFGESKPDGVNQFDVTGLIVGTSSTPPFEPVQDFFARAHFEELSEDDRLTRDSFEKMDAGIQLTSRELTTGGTLGKVLVCEQRVIDSHNDNVTRRGPFKPPLAGQLAALDLSAAALAPLRSTGPRKFSPRAGARPQVVLDDERFVVATTAELSARTDIATPASHADITQALARHLEAHPGDRGLLQIVPLHEVTEHA